MTPTRRGTTLLTLTVTLLAVVLTMSGCGTETTRAETKTTANPQRTPSNTVEEPVYRSFIATVRPDLHNIKIFDEAAGAPLQLDSSGKNKLQIVTIDNPLPSKAPATFLVKTPNVEVDGAIWHEVYLPVRPNGSVGWIKGADVAITNTDLAATIKLGRRELTLRDKDQVVATYPVAIGAADTVTPVGVYYVKELVKPTNADGSYGPLAYGLSAFSPTLVDTEAFADGVIGIHGTNKPELIGQAVSHGCVRMKNESILALQTHGIPLGMPVTIVA